MDNRLRHQIANLEELSAIDSVISRLEAGDDPAQILADCHEGMVMIGKRYEEGEYAVSDLIMAGEIFKHALALLASSFLETRTPTKGVLVIGTVQGDIHEIGKDLVVGMLRTAGYDVHDLGVDVPPETFVEELKTTGARVIGLSGLISVAFDSMKATVDAIQAAGLRDQVTVLIGGGIIDQEVCAYTGADDWCRDAAEAVQLFDKYMSVSTDPALA